MIDYVTFYIITAVISIHYIADFIFQPRKIAKEKSEYIDILTIHILLYTLVFYILSLVFIFPMVFYGFDYHIKNYLTVLFVIYIFGTHWGTDYITSRLGVRFWKSGREKAFWNMVGFDQVIHLVSIFGFFAFVNYG